MEIESPARRVQRVRHELKRRELQVAAAEHCSPGFVRLTLSGEALADFTSLSFDDHVKLILEPADGTPVMRDYTPRAFSRERRELVLEFALHGHGAASEWARRATPGDRVVVGGPRGSMIVPTDYDWHLLAGDATALPAVAKRLEELPAGARAFVLLQADDADRRELPSAAEVALQWLDPGQDLAAAVAALDLPGGEGYAWAAGEATAMARVREVLLHGKGHPKEAMRVAAYWKQGASAFHETLES
jgi:NADPH-dependent ferric siderophore reductase